MFDDAENHTGFFTLKLSITGNVDADGLKWGVALLPFCPFFGIKCFKKERRA